MSKNQFMIDSLDKELKEAEDALFTAKELLKFLKDSGEQDKALEREIKKAEAKLTQMATARANMNV